MEWSFNYIAITNQVEEAKILDECGIQQIMVDTEILGKVDRQKGKNTIISDHVLKDVSKLSTLNLSADIVCRINPFNENTRFEVDKAIEFGAQHIMVPMITSVDEFLEICSFTAGRCKVIPLIETPYSLLKLEEILSVKDLEQVHFGLNDLYLALGMKNLFEVLLSPIFTSIFKWTKDRRSFVGVGGIGNPTIPNKVDPLLLLDEHLRIGSTSLILSRSFFSEGYNKERIVKSLNVFEDRINTKVVANSKEKLIEQVYGM